MKIFDCFSFSHELDILEIRLNELNDVVDVFVLTESEQTFTGLKKELTFLENKDRFQKFLHKIRYIQAAPINNLPTIDDYKTGEHCMSCWQREYHQMNAFNKALYDAQPEDLIMINPVDEIPRAEVLKKIIPTIDKPHCCILDLYFYKLNLMAVNNQSTLDFMLSNKDQGDQRAQLDNEIGKSYKWFGSVITPFKFLNPNFWPHQHNQKPWMGIIKDAGWHYTYVSPEEEILRKIKSFSHADEFRDRGINNIDSIKSLVQSKKEILVGDRELAQIELNLENTPKYVMNNLSKFKHLIL